MYTHVSNCIGTGIKPQSKAKDAEFRKKIQELWLKWTDESDAAHADRIRGLVMTNINELLKNFSTDFTKISIYVHNTSRREFLFLSSFVLFNSL